MDLQERIKYIIDTVHFTCPVCGQPLYVTYYDDRRLTFHCSSGPAKFWTFERGTPALATSKSHWDRSQREAFIDQFHP